MLRKEDFMVMQALAQRGLYLCDIAKQVGVHPRTVRRVLDRGGAPAPPRAARRGSRLDPYRANVDRLLAEDIWNAVVIFRELQTQRYTGRLSILQTPSGRNGRCGSGARQCGLRPPRAGCWRVIGAEKGVGSHFQVHRFLARLAKAIQTPESNKDSRPRFSFAPPMGSRIARCGPWSGTCWAGHRSPTLRAR